MQNRLTAYVSDDCEHQAWVFQSCLDVLAEQPLVCTLAAQQCTRQAVASGDCTMGSSHTYAFCQGTSDQQGTSRNSFGHRYRCNTFFLCQELLPEATSEYSITLGRCTSCQCSQWASLQRDMSCLIEQQPADGELHILFWQGLCS